MREADTFVALDIGTSKVCALVIAADAGGGRRALGAGVASSAGVRKGVVVGVEEVVEAVTLALRRAERLAHCQPSSAIVSVCGAHLSSLNSRGVAPLSPEGVAIESDDVDRAIDAARAVLLPPDREPVHVLARGFTVDGQAGIRNPIGMVARRLDAEVHVVSGETTPLRNLEQCLRRAGIVPVSLVAQGLAAAEAVVSAEEKDLGVAVVDVGAGTCDLTVFVDGSPLHTIALPVGGNNVTRDVAIGLRVPLDVAEELKLSFASADPETGGRDEMLSARSFGGTLLEVSRRDLCEIVAARVDDTLRMLRAEIARLGIGRVLPAGFVFTGGGSELDGFIARAAHTLESPVRLGRPLLPTGAAGTIDGPAYATLAGLARWRYQALREPALSGSRRATRSLEAGRTAVATLQPVAQRFAGWLRAFLP